MAAPTLHDRLVFAPADVDLARSPLARDLGGQTFVLGAFNPGLTRLPSGRLLMLVRVAEALREPVRGERVHAIRWDKGVYRLDGWPLAEVDMGDPRVFRLRGTAARTIALTSLSWLLPVELSPDGLRVETVHYDRAVAPTAPWQCYGLEDPRIARVDDAWLMTVCSVSPERHATALYRSADALDWRCEGLALDHGNKDMGVFEGRIAGEYWAQTRPLGEVWFAYPPGSAHAPGPSINLARSPDGRHWRPDPHPGLRPRSGGQATVRMGGGAPPVRATVAGQAGWLSLWHGVAPGGDVGIYRTYWSLLGADEPWRVLAEGAAPLLEPAPALTAPLGSAAYLSGVVFTTGLVDGGDRWIVASGEGDLACRITHIAKDALV